MDTLRSIEVFCLTVELRSFAAAARRLDMSPAMASKHIAQLERRLGTRLLNRTSRRLSLTESGSLYFERTRTLLDGLADVEAIVRSSAQIPRGVLKISAPVWFAHETFVRILAGYRARYPQVQLDIDLSGHLVDLVSEGIDLALRVTPNPGDGLVARPLGHIRFIVVGSPAYFARNRRPARLADLDGLSLLSYSLIAGKPGLPVEGPDGPELLNFVGAFQSNNETLLHLAALQGLGLACLPTWLVAEDLQAGRLEAVLTDYRMPEATILGVYAHRRQLAPKVRTFLDYIADRLRPEE